MTNEEALNIIGKFEPDTRIDSIVKLDALLVAMRAIEKQIESEKNC